MVATDSQKISTNLRTWSIEQLVQLVEATVHHFCLRKSLVKCHVSQLGLLLLDFQEAGLDGVLDDKLDGRHRPCLAQAMLRETTDQPDAFNNAQIKSTNNAVYRLVLHSRIPMRWGKSIDMIKDRQRTNRGP
jgi:hypothetical protein